MNACPQCGTVNPEVEVVESNGPIVTLEYTCNWCGWVWNEDVDLDIDEGG